MKKSILFVLILCACILTGCTTKNYKTVDEYSAAMNEVKQKLGDYKLQLSINTKDIDYDCMSYKKGDRWKTETSHNHGKSYNDGILYDGNEIYSYSKSNKMAMSIPFKQMLSKQGANNSQDIDLVMKLINPAGVLFYWDIDEIKGKDGSLWEFAENTQKNNFKCRMLHHKQGGEVCVSDKYGIAVYAKINAPKKGEIEYNVHQIDNSPIPDNEIGLPEGVKIMSMGDMFRNMANMFKN